MYYAHSAPKSHPNRRDREVWEPLAEHLRDVAKTAACFAAPFGAAEEARVAGLLHDLGKYSESFTRRLAGTERGLDHWSAGTAAALQKYGNEGRALAMVIQGHHLGLDQGESAALRILFDLKPSEKLRLTEGDLEALLSRLAADGFALPSLEASLFRPQSLRAAGMLDVRMLFSALVDADYLETEAHFERGLDGAKAHRPASPALEPEKALGVLTEYLEEVARRSKATGDVNQIRADLLGACLAGASLDSCRFTLTAPTGAGKTLAMLAFALRHAQLRGLRRIVVAIPYLTILEQTARIYRQVFEPTFGPLYVLEHHSLAGTKGSEKPTEESDDQGEHAEAQRRRGWMTENWDAPLILTTNVQLLESLFANRPGPCRKLHRLARSVVLFDEVQTLPPPLAISTLATLSHLAERYGSSVVFATATQPAFSSLDQSVKTWAPSGWTPLEIVPQKLDLFQRSRRVKAFWHLDRSKSWSEIAEELAGRPQALVIVNLKRHAQDLLKALRALRGADVFHLSTNLCPAHREVVLAQVRVRLDPDRGGPCVLVSTQCVEAGVDLDFPVVYRAFGPLDSIAQAAGRCNRNGLLGFEGGELHVFLPEEERYPPGGYEQAASAARILYNERGAQGMDLGSAELFRCYYQTLYDLTQLTRQTQGKAKDVRLALESLHFADLAKHYRLIEDDTVNLLVPYDLEAYRSLREKLDAIGHLTKDWMREARAHTINVYRQLQGQDIRGYFEAAPLGRGEKSEDWFFCPYDWYDGELLGFKGIPEIWIA